MDICSRAPGQNQDPTDGSRREPAIRTALSLGGLCPSSSKSITLSSFYQSWLVLSSITLAMAPECYRGAHTQPLGMQIQTAHVSFIQTTTGTTARPCQSISEVSESRQGCYCHPNFQRQREACHNHTAVLGKQSTVMFLSCCWGNLKKTWPGASQISRDNHMEAFALKHHFRKMCPR